MPRLQVLLLPLQLLPRLLLGPLCPLHITIRVHLALQPCQLLLQGLLQGTSSRRRGSEGGGEI